MRTIPRSCTTGLARRQTMRRKFRPLMDSWDLLLLNVKMLRVVVTCILLRMQRMGMYYRVLPATEKKNLGAIAT